MCKWWQFVVPSDIYRTKSTVTYLSNRGQLLRKRRRRVEAVGQLIVRGKGRVDARLVENLRGKQLEHLTRARNPILGEDVRAGLLYARPSVCLSGDGGIRDAVCLRRLPDLLGEELGCVATPELDA